MRVNEKIPVFSGYKKYIADILLVGMFLFALVWCFWYYTIGATWWQDETYQALLCIHYLHSPVTFLSAWMGNVWMKIFGEQLLALRILSGICYLSSTAITTGYFWRIAHNWRWTLLLATVMIFTFRIYGVTIYGWDAGAIGFIAALSVFAFSYVANPRIWKIMVCGILCAFIGVSRLPSLGFALPLMLGVVVYVWRHSPYSIFKTGVLGIGVWISVMWGLITIFYGSLESYLYYIHTCGSVSGHGVEMWKHIVWRDLWYDINVFTRNNLPGDLVIAAGLSLICLFRRYAAYIALITICVMMLPCIQYPEFLPKVFIWLVMAFFIPVNKLVLHKTIDVNPMLFVVAAGCCFISAIGSDRFLLRTEFGMSFPLLMILLYRYRNGILLWMIAIVIMSAGIRLSVMMYRIENSDDMASVEMPGHRGIKDTSWRRNSLSSVCEQIEPFLHQGYGKVGFFGWDHYIPMFFYDRDNYFCLNEFHYRDPEHTRRIIREYAGYYDAVAVMPEQTDCFYGESLVSEMHAVGFNLLPCGNDTSDMRIYFYVKNDILKNRRHNGSY